MESNWAHAHLQVIRTLMERSAVYRRALAPVMLMMGLLGMAAAVLGWVWRWDSCRAFTGFWLAVSLTGLCVAYLLVRRQALLAGEPFWSPPTRRVTEAVSPAFFGGLITVILMLWPGGYEPQRAWWLVPAWMLLYGCAIHAAGFFMPRGIRLFGWLFILAGSGLALGLANLEHLPDLRTAHWMMGGFFGGLHLAYGIYLYLTEKPTGAA
jgi:hypothetical protein